MRKRVRKFNIKDYWALPEEKRKILKEYIFPLLKDKIKQGYSLNYSVKLVSNDTQYGNDAIKYISESPEMLKLLMEVGYDKTHPISFRNIFRTDHKQNRRHKYFDKSLI